MDVEKAVLSEFIECYKNNPALWEHTSPDYTNKYIKEQAYNELVPILQKLKNNASVEDVKRKINTMRSGLRRELKKIRETELSMEETYVPTVWWYDQLKFLYCDGFDDSKGHIRLSIKPDESAKHHIRKRMRKSKKKSHRYMSRSDIEMTHAIAKVWGKKLQKLGLQKRLQVEKAINDIFFEAELENTYCKSQYSSSIEEDFAHSFKTSPSSISSGDDPLSS